MNRWNHKVALDVPPVRAGYGGWCNEGYEVWLTTEDYGDGLVVEFCGEDFVDHMSEPPAWLEHELNCDSLHLLVMGPPYPNDNERTAHWLLAHGIAPGQPFRVRLSAAYWRSYEGEYDSDHEVEVIDIYPWPEGRAATAWGNWLWEHFRTIDREAA